MGRVTWPGWSRKYDMWLPNSRTRAYAPKLWPVGAKVEVEWRKQWWPARIVTVERGLHFVHYDGFPDSDDDGEYVHGRAAREQVRDHLRGDGLRVGTHTLGGDAVIGRGDDDGLCRRAGQGIREDAGRPHMQILETPEGCGGFRDLRLASECRLARRLVGRLDAIDDASKVRRQLVHG